MSEWYDNQKKSSSNFHQLLQERIEQKNPRRELTTEETYRLRKLECIADKLKRGENVQNRQLQTWLSEEEYEKLSDDSRLTNKQSVKLAVVELAMHNIGRDAAPVPKDDVAKLDKFLNADD